MDTADINEIEYTLPWEDLDPGPIGEYVEVIDYDPTIDLFYSAVNLDAKHILVENGLRPSESNPQFHQQMVYAVAMKTIKNFEKALGRKVLWSTRLLADEDKWEEYVPKLRLYPHALRDANAYYSPHKKAVLFGYFASTPANSVIHMPNSLVFTCTSHDIIAHEVTHAILDGIYRHYNNPTNPDVLAFHEAFADIVALFQHFTFPEVLKHQIRKTRGNLENQNLLGQLAWEFGSAIGSYGSLRDAIGKIDQKTKEWVPHVPHPGEYQSTMEPHKRGSILVAAVFEAFLNIYKRRVGDLLSIATNGSGILGEGELHPDLVNRLAKEAAKSASHVLNMCIRALDYCPPVDITFGDYLRAIITADSDLVSDDNRDYRLAFIEAFRRRGIYPDDLKTLSVESLRFKKIHEVDVAEEGDQNEDVVLMDRLLQIISEFLKSYGDEIKYKTDRKEIYDTTRSFIGDKYEEPANLIKGLHERIGFKFNRSKPFSKVTGLAFYEGYEELGLKGHYDYNMPNFQIQNLRMVSRVGPDNNQINHVVFSIFQKCGVVMTDQGPRPFVPDDTVEIPERGFEFYGGCTLIFDLDRQELKYSISKPLLDVKALDKGEFRWNLKRILAQYDYQFDSGLEFRNDFSKYFGIGLNNSLHEPFALLHQH
jgi:hypothetical protein